MDESREKVKEQYLRGVRKGIPVIFGFIPVAIAYAVMARQGGLSTFETVLMSALVFAGAAQMMAVEMIVQGSGPMAIIIATFILNLRHLIMRTCVVERMKEPNLRKKLLAAFGVTDESFAIFTSEPEGRCTTMYFLGLITVTYGSWVAGTVIGAVASDLLPPIVSASLGVSLYAMFIAILTPNIRGNKRIALLVILTAAVNSILNKLMASSWALIASTLICAFAGTFFVEMEDEPVESIEISEDEIKN